MSSESVEYRQYERAYGLLCDRSRSHVEDAKLIRSTVKEWQRVGIVPADAKVSVRSRSFAGGCAVDVTVTVPWTALQPLTWRQQSDVEARNPWNDGAKDWFAPQPAYADAIVAIEDLHSSLNYDGSDTQTDYFDVKFYGHVEVSAGWGVKIIGRSSWEHTAGFSR